MSGIAGLRGTGDWGTDERPKSFREGILRFNPNGTAPIFALSSKAKKRSVTDPEFAWWCEGNVLIRLQVNGAHLWLARSGKRAPWTIHLLGEPGYESIVVRFHGLPAQETDRLLQSVHVLFPEAQLSFRDDRWKPDKYKTYPATH